MSKERDYSTTGPNNGGSSGSIYLNWYATKGVLMHKSRGEVLREFKGFSGFLDNLLLRFSEGNEKYNIPARWEVLFQISAIDPVERQEALDSNGEISVTDIKPKDFFLQFPLGSRNTEYLLNSLLTAVTDQEWNGFINFSGSAEPTGKTTKDEDTYSLYVSYSLDGLRYANYFEWDNENFGFKGVAKSILLKSKEESSDGKAKYDNDPPLLFWIAAIVYVIQQHFLDSNPEKGKQQVLSDFSGLAMSIFNKAIQKYSDETFLSTNPEVIAGNYTWTKETSTPVASKKEEAPKKTVEEMTVDLAIKKWGEAMKQNKTHDQRVKLWLSGRFQEAIFPLTMGDKKEVYEKINVWFSPKQLNDEGELVEPDIIDDLPF